MYLLGDCEMANDFEELERNYFAKLSDLKQRSMNKQLDYTTYQSLLRDLNLLEQDGIKMFNAQSQIFRSQQQFGISTQIDEVIKKWQKDTADLLKFFKIRSPSR